jgi:hypothetical protein
MQTSENINELATALCNAQHEMGGAIKDSQNPFFKSKYADLTSVIKAIKEPFTRFGLSYTQFPISNLDGIGVITTLMHRSGQWMREEFVIPLTKRDPQAAASLITYARRYALQSMAGIPTADDDAESAMMVIGERHTPEQQKDFVDLLENGSPTEFVSFYRPLVESIKIDLFNSFDKGKKTEMKKRVRDLETKGLKIFATMKSDVENAMLDEDMRADICDDIEHLSDSEKKFFAKYIGNDLKNDLRKLLADQRGETAIEMGTD